MINISKVTKVTLGYEKYRLRYLEELKFSPREAIRKSQLIRDLEDHSTNENNQAA
ncbi:MAG: hypothetical protein HRT72_13060 [Flavobacteriales bacterium]|nr:hypothetical protein [Flavobacteriales bacterium]